MKPISCLILALCFCHMLYAHPYFVSTVFLHEGYKQTIDNDAGDEDSSSLNKTHMDITASDGIKIKATYYAPNKPGPAILLLHQCNMDRRSWDTFAIALAKRGIHVLTFDYRGFGETPAAGGRENLSSDIDAVLATLMAMPGIDKNRVAIGGASCSVNNAVQLAERSGKIKVLVLLSGPTTDKGLTYLNQHPELAIFGAASSEEDFAVKALTEMVATSKNTASTMKIVHNAGHGAPMFTADPDLLVTATNWLVKMLVK